MSAIRGMLARVQRLEAARRPRPSPFGHFDDFRAQVEADVAAGRLGDDFPLAAIAAWHRNDVWSQWHRSPNRVWSTS
jgi:hypothetical protein